MDKLVTYEANYHLEAEVMSNEYTTNNGTNSFLAISAKYLGVPFMQAGAGRVRGRGYPDNRTSWTKPVETSRGKEGQWHT